MIPRSLIFLITLTLVALGNWTRADSQETKLNVNRDRQLFTEANDLFNSGNSVDSLQKALDNYSQLIKSGYTSANLYYNLGNTHLRLKNTGLAILNFHKALQLEPGHAYAQAMLESARLNVVDKFEEQEGNQFLKTVFFWHYSFSFRQRGILCLITWCAFWLMITLKLFTKLPLFRTSLAIVSIAFLASGSSLAFEQMDAKGVPGVLIAEETEVRRGHNADDDLIFESPLKSGVEVRVLETRNLWKQVQFPGGVIGWVQANKVAELR